MKESRRKYPIWANFLKKHREKRFRSAREFCSKKDVGISYPQYSRYESGDQLPGLEQALSLCQMLGVPLLEGMMEWSRAQISDGAIIREIDSLLAEFRVREPSQSEALTSSSPIGQTVPLDDVIVFNRSHLKLFSSDPTYRDIFTYVNSCSPDLLSVEDVASAIKLPLGKTQKMLEKLRELGVIVQRGNGYGASKRNFYFPDDADFFDLRSSNLAHNAKAIISNLTYDDLAKRKAYRGLLTRELTSEQAEYVIQRLEDLVSKVIGFPESERADKVFSLCLLLGQRFNRPMRNSPGLTLGQISPKTELSASLE